MPGAVVVAMVVNVDESGPIFPYIGTHENKILHGSGGARQRCSVKLVGTLSQFGISSAARR